MARKPQENPQLDMTPMIDVVFELIIFFVVTIKQEDILSRLNVNRPAPSPPSAQEQPKDDISCTIEIGRNVRNGNREGVYVYNKKEVPFKQLEVYLRDTASVSTETPIIVKCTLDSPHKALVDLLDVCYKYKLYSVSVFTL